MIPLPVITALVGAAMAFAVAWIWQDNSYSAQINTMQRDQALAALKSLERAHDVTVALQADKDRAEKSAEVRRIALARDLRGARDALVGLSNAADGALRTADTSHATCLATASTLSAVFGECAAERTEVAKEAAGHLSDKQTLTEAWPKCQ